MEVAWRLYRYGASIVGRGPLLAIRDTKLLIHASFRRFRCNLRVPVPKAQSGMAIRAYARKSGSQL